MSETRHVRCRQCRARVRLVRMFGGVSEWGLARHVRANPRWSAAGWLGRVGGEQPTEVCPGTQTPSGLHEVLVPKRRARAACPGCYRMIAVTPAGQLHKHECTAPARGGEPLRKGVPPRPAPRRAIRVREDEE